MAEEDKKQPPKVTTPSWWQNMAMQAGNAVMLNHLPEFMEMIGNEGDADKVRQGLAQGHAANPKTSWLGYGAGMAVTGGLAKKAITTGLSAVPWAASTAAGKTGLAYGLARAKDLAANGQMLAGKAWQLGSPLATAGTLGYFLGPDNRAPDPAAVQAAAGLPAAAPTEAAPAVPTSLSPGQATAPARQYSGQELQSIDYGAALGVSDPETAIRLVNNGTITPDMVRKSLMQAQRRVPTYKDVAYARIMDGIGQAEAEALSIPDPAKRNAAISAVRRRTDSLLMQMLGADEMLMQNEDPNAQ